MSYSLTINSSPAAREHAAEKGYNFVFAKGVSSGGDFDYNTAWFVLNPNEIGDSVTVSWQVVYKANFTNQMTKNGAKIVVAGNTIGLQTGGYYQVDKVGHFGPDPNRPVNPSKPAFHFLNSEGYANEYTPVLLTQDNNGNMVPFWAADTGVTHKGAISALPVEVVRVWLGKYDAGTAVLADYTTQAVEFNLTEIFSGTATIDDTLSEWNNLSSNAKTIDSYAAQFAAKAASKNVPLFSGLGGAQPQNALKARVANPPVVAVRVLFYKSLRLGAVTFLTSNLINLIGRGDLKPKVIKIAPTTVEVEFFPPGDKLLALGTDEFESAVEAALNKAKKDPKADMGDESWKLTETIVAFTYDV